jgi:hypothetical protein
VKKQMVVNKKKKEKDEVTRQINNQQWKKLVRNDN